MSTEHVEDLLSAYLDNALTQEEWFTVALHLQTCDQCNTVLEDFRRFDELLSTQPRMKPGTSLRERVFAVTDYLDFFEDSPEDYSLNNGPVTDALANFDMQLQQHISANDTERIFSVAPPTRKQPATHARQETKAFAHIPQRRDMRIQHSMYIVIAACLLLTLGVSSAIGWSLWRAQSTTTTNTQDIIPPQSPQQGGPLPAGIRFVYLSNGALWSSPGDNSAKPARLTSSTVMVAPHWTANPPSAHHVAGNLLAYIDMKQGYVHIIRSDGQNDTRIQQRVLPNSTGSTTSAWNSSTGNAVIDNLSWSPDGETLAFVAFSNTTSTLYLYSTATNMLHAATIPTTGSIADLTWSPNGVRIACTQTNSGKTSILDYNTLTKQALIVTTLDSLEYPLDHVLSLDWSPVSSLPAITWSTGSIGTTTSIHEVAIRYVGTETSNVQVLVNGDFSQESYSQVGDFGNGDWLLTKTFGENEDTLFSLSLAGVFSTVANGNLIKSASWTPNGQDVTYLDTLSSQVSAFHSVIVTGRTNMILAQPVDSTPEPALSDDGQNLLYCSATHVTITDAQKHTTHINLPGMVSGFLWSVTSPHTAIVTLQTNVDGIYLVNTQANTIQLVSTQQAVGALAWTQVS